MILWAGWSMKDSYFSLPSKYSLNTFYVSVTVLGIIDATMNKKTTKPLPSWSLHSSTYENIIYLNAENGFTQF